MLQITDDGGLGSSCSNNEDCDSAMCGMGVEENRCTMACNADATNSCPAGFSCLEEAGLCWPDAKDNAAKGGCQVGKNSSMPFWVWLLPLGGLFAFRRRKARVNQRS